MLSYKLEGQGPHLLLIHGWGVTFNIWQNLAPLLASDFTLVMIELPGLGGSGLADPHQSYYDECASAIQELREALNIEQWSVLSYSAGTRAGEAYVKRDAAHVTRAAFLCPAYLNRWRSMGLGFFLHLDEHWPQIGDWMLSDWRLHNLVVWLAFNGNYHAVAADWTKEISTQPVLSLKASLRDLPAWGHRAFDVSGLQTLFIYGRHDQALTRPRRLQANDRLIPTDHSAPMLAAQIVAEAILPFLAIRLDSAQSA
jgi:pimeloyl-ACP methyl ester carboxylesterase